MNRAGIGGSQPVRAIDGSVCRNLKEKKLANSRQQDFCRRPRPVRWRRSRNESAKYIIQLAETTHGLIGNGAGETAVTRGKQSDCFVKRGVEGTFAAKTLTKRPPRRQARRNTRRRCGIGRNHLHAATIGVITFFLRIPYLTSIANMWLFMGETALQPMTAISRQNKDTFVRDRIRAAAEQALKEATARRSQRPAGAHAKEVGGPVGPEPTRYGDWERKGIASDF